MSSNDTTFGGSEVLEYQESAHEANRFWVGIKGRSGWLLSILHSGEQLVAAQRANLRRLIACWNACAGIETELLEGFSPGFLARYPDRALAERRALQAHSTHLFNCLVKAVEGAGYSLAGPTDSMDATNGDPDWVCDARAEIENAMEREGNKIFCKEMIATRSKADASADAIGGEQSPAGAPISLLSERTILAIQRYLDAAFLREQNGATLRDREESRSYAVELVTAILIENPEATGFDKHCQRMYARRRKQPV